jgi:hypothetical protein
MGRRREVDDSLEVLVPEGAPPVPPPVVPRSSSGWERRRRPPTFAVVLTVLTVAVMGLGMAGGKALRTRSLRSSSTAAGSGAPAAPAETPPRELPPRAFTALTTIVDRTTIHGIRVEVQRPTGQPGRCGHGVWCPPPDCLGGPVLFFRILTAAGVAGGEAIEQPAAVAPPMYVGGANTGPMPGGALAAWAAVRVPEATRTTDLVLDDEVLDTAPTTDGWAVVTGPLPGSGSFEVVARDGDATELGRLSLDDPQPSVQRTLPSRCEAPAPALPLAGAAQPADPAAAREAVRAAFVDVFDHASTREARLAAVDDPSGLDAPMDRVLLNFRRAVETTTVEVADIVFTSPRAAAVHFHLDYEGGSSLGNRTGYAVAGEDGRWRVTRATYCAVLAGASAPCPPAASA